MWLYCTGSSSPSATNPRWSSSLNASASGRQKNKTTNALKIALPLPTDFWDKLLLYAGYVYLSIESNENVPVLFWSLLKSSNIIAGLLFWCYDKKPRLYYLHWV